MKKQEEPNPSSMTDENKPEPAETTTESKPKEPTSQPAPKTQDETKKNLVDAVRAALDPVFAKLTMLIEMGGDVATIAQEIWMSLKNITGDSAPMPDVPKSQPEPISQEEIGKMISSEVNKQVEHILQSVQTLRKGVIQNEEKKEDIQKTFDGLAPEKKLRVALATLNK